MRGFLKAAAMLACLLVVPSAAWAQASIAGTVRDASGAVLPGVTIEAASPVLIEKVRSVVTNGAGQYRIVDLRPGTYTVTFTLAGFTTVRREGITLSGTGTASVDVDMRVGSLEETITVTGEAPIVDVQNVTRQNVLGQEVIDALPTTMRYAELGALLPGVVSNDSNVGGAAGDDMSSLSVHGSRNVDQRILNNGVNTSGVAGQGHISGVVPNANAAAEIVMDTSAASAELAQGGVRINYIPRDGGNTFSGSFNFAWSNADLQGNNFTPRLQELGLSTPDTVERIWDLSGGFGGPILRDRLWFWSAASHFGNHSGVAGMFYNKNAFNPDVWVYEPDLSRPAVNKGRWWNAQTRLTFQASPTNKLAFSYDQQDHCRCPDQIGAQRAPEAARDRRFPQQRIMQAEWTAPITSSLLLEVVGLHRTTRWGNMHMGWTFPDEWGSGLIDQMVAVQEQSTGLWYRNRDFFNNNFNHNFFFRGAVSYVTGSHSLKTGFTDLTGWLENTVYASNPVSYRFNNGVPNRITSRAAPWFIDVALPYDFGLFVQDRWTMDRLTINLGMRYDALRTGWPESTIGPGELVPTRNLTFEAEDDSILWKDITYRSGASYDLFGDGRTAVKVSLNKYVAPQTLGGLGSSPHPVNTLVNVTNRSWNDANGDFVPDCDLTSPLRNGECGPMSNQNFGTSVPGDTFDPGLMHGWGKRPFDWEFSLGVQREILPRVSVDVGYFRRWFGNFQVEDNVLVDASDFDTFSIVAPADSRLPGGGGQTIGNLFNITPEAFGREQIMLTLSDKYGKQIEHWNGVDVSANARLQNGVLLQGGVSTGRRTEDNCAVRAVLPEIDPTNPYCRTQEAWQTQVKLLGAYTIPRIDVLVSGTLQSYPGPALEADFRAGNALVSPSLGRPLAGEARNVTVNLIEPGTEYGERLNQVDLRIGKIFRFAGTRTSINLDLHNALNADTIMDQNENFGPAWLTPQGIILARFARITATFDF